MVYFIGVIDIILMSILMKKPCFVLQEI